LTGTAAEGMQKITEALLKGFREMEWNTFVDDAKDMGTSIFETFSSAFNNAMDFFGNDDPR